MDLVGAQHYLEEHINMERLVMGRQDAPTLDRMRRLVHVMGDPHLSAPVIHITGTNGKGSTAQMVTRLLMAHGLSVGTYSSPHLQRLNERIARNAEPISDDELAAAISDVAAVDPISGITPSWFEIVTAAMFGFFADNPVDALVVEVGLLGRWDATNVADAPVAVVTNVAMDHAELAGPTRAHIAAEKAGIVKPGSTLVLGETDPDLVPIFRREPAAAVWEREIDFDCIENRVAIGGRVLALKTPSANYEDVFVPLHGAHQGDNAACALAAVEAFFGGPPDPSVVHEGFADVVMPGRFEVVARQPLIVLDGAHNPAGALVAAATLDEEFDVAGERFYVIGMLRGRDPVEMLRAIDADEARLVVCCTPDSPRALPATEVARAATSIGAEAVVVDDVARAIDRASRDARADDLVFVSGSLYVVGAARTHLVGRG